MNELDTQPGCLETDSVEVRTLTSKDLPWVVNIDAQHSGRTRSEYFKLKLREAEKDTGVQVSLAAFVDGEPAGFLMARTYYGEFGLPEPVTQLDSIAVSKGYAGRHVAEALMRQLSMNLRGLGIATIQTQVEWDQLQLIGFFQHAGFKPAARLCLELDLQR